MRKGGTSFSNAGPRPKRLQVSTVALIDGPADLKEAETAIGRLSDEAKLHRRGCSRRALGQAANALAEERYR